MTRSGLPLPSSMLKKLACPRKAIEFQMLYGIRRDLQEQLVKEGYPVRVLRSIWYALVSLLYAPPGGTTGQYLVLHLELSSGSEE